MTEDDAPPTDDRVPERFRIDLEGQTVLGVYEVREKLAEGGMGSIFRAEDTSLGRPVVVKVPHGRFLAEAGFRARLAREVSELVRLEHPHVVRILARGEIDDIPFFVLQYLGGGSLEDKLEAGARQSPDEILAWLPVMARTLDFVHKRGSLHRDVKPGNILLDEEGHVFLSDFGVAKAVDAEGDALTGTGVGIGSPKYMAPEQALGTDVGPAADQYGLASTVYEALSGEAPFHGGSPVQILVRKSKEEAEDIREKVPDLPEEAAAALMRAMAREASERFPTCEAFSEAFAQGLGVALDATPAGGTQTMRHIRAPLNVDAEVGKARRLRRLLESVLAIVLVGIALFSFVMPDGDDDEPNPPPKPPRAGLQQVELIDPGAEPRRILRYDVAADARAGLRAAVMGANEITIPGMATFNVADPPWDFEAEAEVLSVDEDGDLHFRWDLGRCALCEGDGEETDEARRDLLNEQVAVLSNVEVEAEATPQGVIHNVEVRGVDDLGPYAARALDGLRMAVNEICTPLPAEPVGVGAMWSVTRRTEKFGMRMVETTDYVLVSVDGNQVRLRAEIALTAPRQEVTAAGLKGPAVAMTLTSFHGQGNGQIRLDLTQLVPRGTATHVEGTFEAESAVAGEAGTMIGRFYVEVEIGRR